MRMFYHPGMRLRPAFRVATAALAAAILFPALPFSTPVGAQQSPAPAAAAVPAAAGLPAKLSDAEFWALVSDFSEPNGYFQSDNFVGNELSFQWVIPSLQKTVAPGGAYLGVGPDQNFTYISALAPRIAFIVDIRRDNLIELLMYKALIELSADRAEFAARLFGRTKPKDLPATATADAILTAVYNLPATRAIYEHNLEAITTHLTKTHGFALTPTELKQLEYIFGSFFSYGPGIAYQNGNNRRNVYPTYWDMQVTDDNAGHSFTYLSTEERFQGLKRMQAANLIVPVTGNFAGPKALKAVGAWLRERGATVTTFYTSNVEQYLFQDNIWRDYYKNVATLPLDDTSTFIRSVFNGAAGFGGYGGLRSAQLTCGIKELVAAVAAGRVNSYYDVINMSR